MAFIICLQIFDYLFSFKKPSGKYVGFIKFLKNSITVILAVLGSGTVSITLGMIVSIPQITEFLNNISKWENIYSRVLIYKNLGTIISKKLLIEYGHFSAIVSRYYGPNAQNGVMQILVFEGLVGLLCIMILVFICVKNGNMRDTRLNHIVLFTIYAFVLSSIVEITLAVHFIILLVLYQALARDPEKVRRKGLCGERFN